MGYEEMLHWGADKLFQEFKQDILGSSESLIKKIEQSNSAKEIRRRGEIFFGEIASYLESDTPQEKEHILAWTFLLSRVEADMRLNDAPIDLCDLRGWVDWVKRNAA